MRVGANDFNSIQAAIDASSTLADDVIDICVPLGGGAWQERLTLSSKNGLILRGNPDSSGLLPVIDPSGLAGGGAVISASGVDLTVERLELVGGSGNLDASCDCLRGGGIDHPLSGYRLTLIDSYIHGNTADKGAGLLAGGELIVQGSEIASNIASQNGGGVLLTGSATANASVDGASTLHHNQALFGAGVYLNGRGLVGGGRINANVASVDGGGAFLASGASLGDGLSVLRLDHNSALNGAGVGATGSVTLQGVELSINTASQNGGGLYCLGGTGLCSVGLTSVLLDDNAAGVQGGGLWVLGAVEASGGGLQNNTAAEGAGAYLERGSSSFNTFNVVSNTASQFGGGLGGGVYLQDGQLTVTNLVISDNEARYGGGGGVYLSSPKTSSLLLLNTSDIRANSADYGGGVVLDGVLSFDDELSVIDGNAALQGGGVWVDDGTLNGVEIRNHAVANEGGGVYVSGQATLIGGSVHDNTAGDGGGLASVGLLTINGTAFSGNHALGRGGGLWLAPSSSGPNTLDACWFDTNTAQDGGAIWVDGALTLSDTPLDNNDATGKGGGLYVGSNGVVSASGPDVAVSGAFIRGSDAQKGAGAMVLGSLSVTDAELSLNSASEAGGAFFVGSSGELTLTRVDVRDNQAENGGGIAVSLGTLTASDSLLSRNIATGTSASASQGGGHISSNGSVALSDVVLSQGQASRGGAVLLAGGSYAQSSSALSASPDLIGNSALEMGGALYIGGTATVTLTTIEVSDNSSGTGSGGAIAAGAGTLNLAGVRFRSNQANTQLKGGAVWLTGAAALSAISTTWGMGGTSYDNAPDDIFVSIWGSYCYGPVVLDPLNCDTSDGCNLTGACP